MGRFPTGAAIPTARQKWQVPWRSLELTALIKDKLPG